MTNSARDTIALVPLRGSGKSRLVGVIDEQSRTELVGAMLADVVAAIRGAGIVDISILAGDARAIALASSLGLPAVPDPVTTTQGVFPRREASLRQAVDAALIERPADNARIVVAADLPRLNAGELFSTLSHPADVVIVPTQDGGTAILRLAPGVVIPTQYGHNSAHAHLEVAKQRGHSTALLYLPGAHQDVDLPPHLSALSRSIGGVDPGAATSAFRASSSGYVVGDRTRR